MSTEPIKKYIAALKAKGTAEAPQLLAEAMGAEKPSNFIAHYSDFLLEDDNELTLRIIANEVQKHG